MAETTTIEWTRNDDGTPGRTWNPVTGCTKVSAGCDNCYAETIAERFRGKAAFPNGFDVTLRANKVNDPLTWRKPTRVFVNSMSDLFHEQVDQAWIADIFAVMAAASRHTFQLLTKRHARMRSLLNDAAWIDQVRSRALGKGLPADRWQWPIRNVHLGVSVEDQKWADIRIPALLDTPAAVRFLSCEPLLGPVDLWGKVDQYGGRRKLTYWLDGRPGWGPAETTSTGIEMRPMETGPRIDWVIAGGESGRGARPAHPDWFRTLRDQCAHSNTPYFFKQWGQWGPMWPLDENGAIVRGPRGLGITVANDGTVYQPGDLSYPDGPRYGEALRAGHDRAHLTAMYSLGKKEAGRELDGRTHDAFPQATS